MTADGQTPKGPHSRDSPLFTPSMGSFPHAPRESSHSPRSMNIACVRETDTSGLQDSYEGPLIAVRPLPRCDAFPITAPSLPIVNDEIRVTGVITDRDICIAAATRGRSAERIAVREVSQGHVYTCVPDDDGTGARQMMKAHKTRRLPVVDADGHVRGMLSLNDVVTQCRRGHADRSGEHRGECLRASTSDGQPFVKA